MSLRRIIFTLVTLLLGIALGGSALADGGHRGGFRGGHFPGNGHFAGHGHFHGHARFGVFIGAPLFWPWYSPAPYYYYPPVVAVPSGPTTYIEQGDEEGGSQQGQGYWHYCADPKGYYPYVKKCPGGWQRVPAQPPPDQ